MGGLIRRREAPPLSALSPFRLLGLLVLFILACAAAVVRSDRFQREARRLVVDAASAALGRRVRFEGASLSIIPPSLALRAVEVAGAPGEAEPFFRAAEVSVAGDVRLLGRTLTLGSVTISKPVIHIAIGPDGRDNLPPGLKRRARSGGLKLRLSRLTVIAGVAHFNEARVPIALSAEGLLAELAAAPGGELEGRAGGRVTSFALGPDGRLPFSFEARFGISGSRLHVDSLRMRGDFGELTASGEIPDLARGNVEAAVRGRLDVGAVEKAFSAELPFSGIADVLANVRVGGAERFSVTATLSSDAITAEGFRFRDLLARAVAGPRGIRARIERASFEDGDVDGVFHIGRLTEKPLAFDLLVSGHRIAVRDFFSDIGLSGTRLASRADATIALSWRHGGPEHGDGGGTVTFSPEPSTGEREVPVSGASRLTIRDGLLRFENALWAMPESTLAVSGGFPLGRWNPDLNFTLTSRDLTVVDRLARNFEEAISRRPSTGFGLAGVGSVAGRLTGTWARPQVEARFSAENFVYGGLRLGDAYSDFSVRDEAFLFHPFRSHDGEAALSLEGAVRYADRAGVPRFNFVAVTDRFPADRLLKYFDFDLPIQGALTGRLPLSGDRETLTGIGDFVLARARLFGQDADRVSARAVFSPGRVAFEALDAELAGGAARGTVSFDVPRRRYGVRLAATGIAPEKINALATALPALSGTIDVSAEGEGSLDDPTIEIEARARRLLISGRPMSASSLPEIHLTLSAGDFRLRGAAGQAMTIEVSGRASSKEGRARFRIDAPELAPLFAAVSDPVTGMSGSFGADGDLTWNPADGTLKTLSAKIRRFSIEAPEHRLTLAATGSAEAEVAGGRLRVSGLRLEGPATSVDVGADLDLASGRLTAGTIRGKVDASAVSAFAMPDSTMAGPLQVDLALGGTLDHPTPSGTIVLSGGYLKTPGSPYVLDAVSARLRLADGVASLQGFQAKVGGGELSASGDARLDGLALREFRIFLSAQNVSARVLEDLRLRVNADLTIAGTPDAADVLGEIRLLSGTYTRDFGLTIANLVGKSRPLASAAAPAWQKALRLQVHIVSVGALEIRNNLARLTASVDLVSRGTFAEPVLLGQVIVDEGGRLTFQDVKYTIESATLTFGNPERTEPIVDLNATTDVRGYAITVQAAGTLGDRSRVQFNFSSDPPLSDEQLTTLLLTGVSPESASATRAQSNTTSSVVGSIAGLAFTPVTSRVQQLFRLDRFQIDPILQSSTGSSGGAVITVGKNISKDLSVTYSYSAETNAQSVLLVDYQIDANKVIELSKDENNVYSIDIKLRKRL